MCESIKEFINLSLHCESKSIHRDVKSRVKWRRAADVYGNFRKNFYKNSNE